MTSYDPSVGTWRARLYDRFRHYRSGMWPYDEDARRAVNYDNPVLPMEGIPPLVIGSGRRQVNKIPYVGPRRHAEVSSSAIGNAEDIMAQVREAQQLVENGFGQKRLFRFVKTLDYGAQSLAVIFEERDWFGAPMRAVVGKIPLRFRTEDARRQVRMERKFMELFRRSKHIVQHIVDDDIDRSEFVTRDDDALRPLYEPERYLSPINVYSPTRNILAATTEPPPRGGEAFPMILMEHMKNGDLAEFLHKVVERNERIPDQILLNFFLCPINDDLRDRPGIINEELGARGDIDVSAGHGGGIARVVHFDMDPKNIFLDFDSVIRPSLFLFVSNKNQQEEHLNTPMLKLGDFGLARHISLNRADLYYEKLRTVGKAGFWCPEQFTNEWDYIPPDSGTVKTQAVAGNYDWHTNIWAIGLVYITYGMHLEEYPLVNFRIRRLIYRCQAHYPRDRPTLWELEEELVNLQEGEDFDRGDQDTLNWALSVLFEPLSGELRLRPGYDPVNYAPHPFPGRPMVPNPGRSVPATPQPGEHMMMDVDLGNRPPVTTPPTYVLPVDMDPFGPPSPSASSSSTSSSSASVSGGDYSDHPPSDPDSDAGDDPPAPGPRWGPASDVSSDVEDEPPTPSPPVPRSGAPSPSDGGRSARSRGSDWQASDDQGPTSSSSDSDAPSPGPAPGPSEPFLMRRSPRRQRLVFPLPAAPGPIPGPSEPFPMQDSPPRQRLPFPPPAESEAGPSSGRAPPISRLTRNLELLEISPGLAPPQTHEVDVVDPALDVLPRPPAAFGGDGSYVPPPNGGSNWPPYTPGMSLPYP
ncbi:hypothetical protein Hte_003195 [Hypoxylon texense]